jgi:hypothetical protein
MSGDASRPELFIAGFRRKRISYGHDARHYTGAAIL